MTTTPVHPRARGTGEATTTPGRCRCGGCIPAVCGEDVPPSPGHPHAQWFIPADADCNPEAAVPLRARGDDSLMIKVMTRSSGSLRAGDSTTSRWQPAPPHAPQPWAAPSRAGEASRERGRVRCGCSACGREDANFGKPARQGIASPGCRLARRRLLPATNRTGTIKEVERGAARVRVRWDDDVSVALR